MRKFLSLMLLAFTCNIAFGQIVVSEFKLTKDEPFGNFPGRKGLSLKFTNESDKDFKYLKVHYYIVNRVGDVISGVERGITEQGKEYIKAKIVSCTGPFKTGKKQKLWSSGVVTSSMKDIVAFPHQIEIIYMGSNESVFIDITKENLSKYFPKLEWIDYNRWNSAM